MGGERVLNDTRKIERLGEERERGRGRVMVMRKTRV